MYVIAHSLGARVAVNALLQAFEQRSTQSLVKALVLEGAALAAGALHEDGEFPSSQLSTDSVLVLYSRHDSTLRDHFPLGE